MTLLLTPFLMPAGFLAVAWLLGLLLSKPRKTRILSRVVLISSYCVFYALSTWPVANLLLEAVQSLPASTDAAAAGMPAAVVVLSGGAAEVDADHPFPELTRSSWRRLWRGVEVYDLLEGKAPLLYSGNDALSSSGSRTGTSASALVARRLGISGDDFWLEDRSQNTYQSAVEVKKLLDSRHPTQTAHLVVLVTSAWHMPRALRAFRGRGLSVLPEPCDYLSGPRSFSLHTLVPSYEALSASSVAIREVWGLLAYRMLGRN